MPSWTSRSSSVICRRFFASLATLARRLPLVLDRLHLGAHGLREGLQILHRVAHAGTRGLVAVNEEAHEVSLHRRDLLLQLFVAGNGLGRLGRVFGLHGNVTMPHGGDTSISIDVARAFC